MPFKIGSSNISKIYKDNTEISRVYKGSAVIYVSEITAPTININASATTTDSIQFTITNNYDLDVDIVWEQGDSTPDANTFSLAANTTSSTITLTGLNDNQTYTIFSKAVIGLFESGVSSDTENTLTSAPQFPTYFNGVGILVNGATYLMEAFQGNVTGGNCKFPDPGIIIDIRGVAVDTIEINADVAWFNSQPRLYVYSETATTNISPGSSTTNYLIENVNIESEENLYQTYGNDATATRNIQRTYNFSSRTDLIYRAHISSCQAFNNRWLKLISFKVNGIDITGFENNNYQTLTT